jgi:molybdate transport system regulatory protein
MARVRRTIKRIPMRRPASRLLSPSSSPRRGSLARHLKPRQKLWLNWDGVFLMGPRYLVFLDAVARTGTIRAAGRVVGWSYRTCLNRVRQMERVLGAKVLATARGGSRGGGARLTAEARRLVKVFAQWRREVDRLSHAAFRTILGR